MYTCVQYTSLAQRSGSHVRHFTDLLLRLHAISILFVGERTEKKNNVNVAHICSLSFLLSIVNNYKHFVLILVAGRKMCSWLQRNDSSISNKTQRVFGAAANGMMQASQQYQGHVKIGEVLHLEGPRISLEELSGAIHCLQRRHPVLRSRLQIHPDKQNVYLLEEDDTLRLRVREISRKSVDHLVAWRREWKEREKEITAIGQGLAEFWLFQVCTVDNSA